MVLQPFVGTWPPLQFHNLFFPDSRTPWTSDQPVARPLPTHRTTKPRINSHAGIHALSGIQTHGPSFRASENSLYLITRGHRDCPKSNSPHNYHYRRHILNFSEISSLILKTKQEKRHCIRSFCGHLL
jgi:hypothetical protein